MISMASHRPTRRGVLFAASAVAGLAVLGAQAVEAADKTVTIAFQTGTDPAKVAQADGLYEKATGWTINWRKFDSGADVIAAIASGDVQIGYVGSSPLAAGATSELPIKTILVADLIGEAEALVVRNGTNITKADDLKGKKIAVPFVSTTHYSLLAVLKHWNIDPKSVQILNLRPPEIAAAWERGDIDGAYVWDPALARLKANGKVLITSKEVAAFGAPTFDAWIVRTDFAAEHPDVVSTFVRVTGQAHAKYRSDPDAWDAKSPEVAKISRITGEKPEDIPASLRGSVFPLLSEQLDLLGAGTVKAIADTSAFLKEQGKVPTVLPDYAAYVEPKFVRQAIAAN
jgi:taurine transport system substrate-binding protein